MGEWGRRPGLRPIHAVSPAAACSPASSTSFYHHHYCYRRRYRYRHHHPTSALAYLVTPSLFLSRVTRMRARASYTSSVCISSPSFFFCIPSIVSTIFSSSSSSSRYLIIFKIYFSFLSFSYSWSNARARTRTHSHSFALFFSRSFSFFVFLCLARTRSSFISYEKDSKPNTQQFIIIYYPYFSPLYLIHMCVCIVSAKMLCKRLQNFAYLSLSLSLSNIHTSHITQHTYTYTSSLSLPFSLFLSSLPF